MNFKTLSDLYSHLDIKGLEYHDSHNIGQLFKELRDFSKGKKKNLSANGKLMFSVLV